MMTGVVNASGEAMLRVVVGDLAAQRIVIDALIDTGYTGNLTLPPSTIAALNLPWRGSEEGVLGDGSTQMFDVYSATIIWDGEFRTIKVNESDTDPLLGVGLLYGYEVCILTISGGTVTVKALPK
ncbi:clan AA aspartic protease [Leptolyngbya sp. NK1-12]|uniref:Clan AA aspartic protease n=1 Tax=Leptolyngbya sp. NK1-12 TaxID=2547451 RepID=A0AA97AQ96_9CYAN|nr:clan AA aspartic protease [Leptolyngbya sp. NK1-12]WNZ23118.1 clan AA aspartic protease [Leptolyngbya sp. NK1-12]